MIIPNSIKINGKLFNFSQNDVYTTTIFIINNVKYLQPDILDNNYCRCIKIVYKRYLFYLNIYKIWLRTQNVATQGREPASMVWTTSACGRGSECCSNPQTTTAWCWEISGSCLSQTLPTDWIQVDWLIIWRFTSHHFSHIMGWKWIQISPWHTQ